MDVIGTALRTIAKEMLYSGEVLSIRIGPNDAAFGTNCVTFQLYQEPEGRTGGIAVDLELARRYPHGSDEYIREKFNNLRDQLNISAAGKGGGV